MAAFILVWLYLFLTFQVCPFFWAIVDKNALDEPIYLYGSFIFCLILNFFINLWREKFNNNTDILYKFITFLLKPFSYIITLIWCELKKLFNFLLFFKYKKIIYIIFNIFKFILNIPGLIWRPIFKKWSYFGYYRTNKSKWFNK